MIASLFQPAVTEKQIINNKPTETLQDLLNLCDNQGIEKATLLNILALYDRLTLDIQEHKGVVKVETHTSVVIVGRQAFKVYPIVLI